MGKPSQVILLNPSLSKQHSATPAFVHLWYAAPLYAELPVWLCSGNVLCSVVLESRYMPCKRSLISLMRYRSSSGFSPNSRYNHTGTQFFEIKKSRPLTGLMDLAKEMTKEALPIKCLEAVILGIYLTNNMATLDRFPISFKTHFSGNYFRHIVLGVNFGGRYGALGISRREELMYKAPVFRTLSELIFDFEEAYRRCWHTLKKVKLGHCVSHDPHSVEQIEWKHSILDLDKLTREDFRKELERHARDMRLKIGKGTGPPSPTKDRKKDVSSPQRGQASPHRRNSRGDRRPSGEKKPPDSKAMPDLNGYQIRV
ncbi:tubulinyl-Tyr carboxypeptidase 1 isoform X2 [Lonchura striata]